MGRRLPLVPVDHLHGHVASLYLGDRSPRAALPLPARERRPHAAPRRARARGLHASSGRRSTTPPARRSTRARGCSASATRAARRSTGWRARATRGVQLPGRARPRPRLLLLRRQDGAAVRRSRPRRRRAERAARRPRGELPARDRAGARRADVEAAEQTGASGSPSSAASPRTRSSARRSPDAVVRAARALHRQRRDDRLGRPVRGRRPVSRLPCARCVRVAAGLRPLLWRSRAALSPRLRPPARARHAPRPKPRRPRRPGSEPGAASSADARPQVAPGPAVIVVLKAPSLAERVAAAGGTASEAQERQLDGAGVRRAETAARRALALQGVRVRPEYTYTRVLNGFSAALDPPAARAARAGARGRRRLPGARRLSGAPSRRRCRGRCARRRGAAARASACRASTAAA